MALSLQGPDASARSAAPVVEFASGVPGVVVVDGSGVPVDGVSVGRDKPALVGGRVEVTKRGGVGAAACCEILIQELRVKAIMRVNIRIFMTLILLGKN
jgi:hypothetical protein